MYNLIRFMIGCVLIVVLLIIVNRSRATHKRLLRVFCILFPIVLMGISARFPVENLFITFHSPESAYAYYNLGKPDIQLVVEGEQSAMIVDNKNGIFSESYTKKSENGWKIGFVRETKVVYQEQTENYIIEVCQYKNTNDYYISVYGSHSKELTISDNYNTEFFMLENHAFGTGTVYYSYYACLDNYPSDYRIMVNSNEMNLEQQ